MRGGPRQYGHKLEELNPLTSSRHDHSLPLPIAIVGGGPTGLATAYRLSGSGRAVRLFESGQRLGGAVGSERSEGWLVESGPHSFQENSREITKLFRELGLENERVTANPAARKRYILRQGKLSALPSSPFSLFTTGIFSWASKGRLLKELFRSPSARTDDLSVGDLVREHFGQEWVDFALNPFVSGIYAGDPEKLSARYAFPRLWQSEHETGSLIRGMLAQTKARRRSGDPKTALISFRSGLQTLTDALARALPAKAVELEAKTECIRRDGSAWKLNWRRGTETHSELFSRIILAVPAPALAALEIGAIGERPLAELGEIEYSAVSSLTLGFRREAVAHPHDGFGLLIPAVEKRKILGVIFGSTLFPHRAPEGYVSLTVMVGGANRPDLVGLDLDALTVEILPELKNLLGATGEPVFRRLHRWPKAIPQYQLGYERFLNKIAVCEKNYPGIFIGGNVRDGIALPACIEAGLRLGAKVSEMTSEATAANQS